MKCKVYLTETKSLSQPLDVKIVYRNFDKSLHDTDTSGDSIYVCNFYNDSFEGLFDLDSVEGYEGDYEVFYIDDENDFISFPSEEDTMEIPAKDFGKFAILLKKNNNAQNKQIKKNEIKVTHSNVNCYNCGTKNIEGNRYKCLECKDMELCSKCGSMKIHSHHAMIIFPKAEISLYTENLKSLLFDMEEKAGKRKRIPTRIVED